MTETYSYTAYGLTWNLPFLCPLLTPAPVDAVADVTVLYGSVSKELTESVANSDNVINLSYTWQASRGRFLLKGGPRTGRFLVEDGNKITIELNPKAEISRVIHHLLHNVMAAALRQRGLLVLHGNAAVISRGAVMVTGMSGAGKSTTLAALLDRGCSMLADDLTVLRQDTHGCVEVLPGIPHLSLCDDAAKYLGIAINGFPRNPLRRAKAVVPVPESMNDASKPLRAIYYIKHSADKSLRIGPVAGASKFAVLQELIYGPLLPQEHPGMFKLLSAVVEQVEFFRVERPIEKWTVQELTEVILNG